MCRESILQRSPRSGDFGYTTGPFVLTDQARGAPPLHGVYFSIWKRGADDIWRVAVTPAARLSPPPSGA
jgi:ketosteroid isomerase-like protein